MNVLRISTRLYPDIGGPAKQAYLFSEFCSKNNIKTIILACKPKSIPYQKIKIVNNNLIIHYLPFSAPGINSSLLVQMIFFISFIILGLIKAIKIIIAHKISLIHGHTPSPTGFLIPLLSKIFKIPYIYSVHGLDYPNKVTLQFEMNLTAKNAEKIITVSKSIKRFIEDNFKPKNVDWFPNSIELKKYFHVNSNSEKQKIIKKLNLIQILDANDYIITYVGHMIFLQKVKGMIDFLHAFKQFKIECGEKAKELKLLFIGEGKYSTLLKQEIQRLKLEHSVYLLGKRIDVHYILSISDALGLTSYIEGFPNVILEAMASKVPCIATNVGEVEHIIGDKGFIVPPGAIDKIKTCIEDCFDFTDNKKALFKKEMYEYVKKNFDIDIIGKRLINLYSNIMKK